MMKIRLLDRVEDANDFPKADPLAVVQPFTIGHYSHPFHIHRVDKFKAGQEVDVPVSQAENLINLGYAELL